MTNFCLGIVVIWLVGSIIWFLIEVRSAPLCDENENPIKE